MTNREFFAAIASNDSLSTEMRDFAISAIAKMDTKNAKRSSKPSKVAVANEPLKMQVRDFLLDGSIRTGSDIATALGLSVPKVTALARQMVNDGILIATDAKIPKVGLRKVYRLADIDSIEAEISAECERESAGL